VTTHRLIDDPDTRDRLSKLQTYWQRKAYECEMHAEQAHSDCNAHRCAYFRSHMIDAQARASIVAGRMVADSAAPGLADVLAKLPDNKIAQIAPQEQLPDLMVAPTLSPAEFAAAAPSTLVELVAWLRARWERFLPALSVETWQTIACAVWLRRKGGAQ